MRCIIWLLVFNVRLISFNAASSSRYMAILARIAVVSLPVDSNWRCIFSAAFKSCWLVPRRSARAAASVVPCIVAKFDNPRRLFGFILAVRWTFFSCSIFSLSVLISESFNCANWASFDARPFKISSCACLALISGSTIWASWLSLPILALSRSISACLVLISESLSWTSFCACICLVCSNFKSDSKSWIPASPWMSKAFFSFNPATEVWCCTELGSRKFSSSFWRIFNVLMVSSSNWSWAITRLPCSNRVASVNWTTEFKSFKALICSWTLVLSIFKSSRLIWS